MIARFFSSVLVVLALFALCAGSARDGAASTLQDQLQPPEWLTLSGTFRARGEWLDGQFRAGLPRDDYHLNLRTTLMAEIDRGRIGGVIELWDARAAFEREDGVRSTRNVNTLEPVQAYVRFSSLPAGPTNWSYDVALGRFTVDLGSRRLVGRHSFRNTSSAFTGVLARFEAPGGQRITAMVSSPQNIRPSNRDAIGRDVIQLDSQTLDQLFWGAYVSGLTLREGLQIEPYVFGLNESEDFAGAERTLFTPGVRVLYEPEYGKVEAEVEAALQIGTIKESPDTEVDVSAWMLHAGVGHRVLDDTRFGLGIDAASGDADPEDDEFNTFDNLFGPRNPDWGPSGLMGPLGYANIVSPYLRLDQWIGERMSVLGRHRFLWLHEARDAFAETGAQDETGDSDRYAGQYSEARIRYWLVPDRVRADLGGVILWERVFLREAETAAKQGDTAYLHFDLMFWF